MSIARQEKDAQKKKPLIGGFLHGFIRQLGEDDRGEHQNAAKQLTRGHRLSEDEPSGDHRNDRFHAHNERGDGWVHAFLADDLQGIAHAGGQRTRVQYGLPRGEDGT